MYLSPCCLYYRLIEQDKLRTKSKGSQAQPGAASADLTDSNTPNAGLYAMPLQHTYNEYKQRFQPASITTFSSTCGSSALQPITNLPAMPPGTARGVSTLIKEGVVPLTALVQHPNGTFVLRQ